MVPTLDAHAAVVKSDSLVPDSLHRSLLTSFETLKADQADVPDWHPNSDDRVQNLVHPSLFPLVYNRTRAFQDEVVGVEDAIDEWSGKGEVVVGEKPWVPDRFRFGVGGACQLSVKTSPTTSLPMWDQCLKTAINYTEVVGPGRNEGRFGVPARPE